MQANRTINATRNIFFGVVLKFYQILIPFLMRTAMIYFMGVEYLGLNSLFTSVLQVLNLAELGVGSAMVYSMYRPIAEGDKKTICALMALYRKYYHVIGAIIAVVGIACVPLVPRLIKNSLPNGVNIYVLYLLNLAGTVLSYWLFAYKNSLFQAHQRNDVSSKITLCTTTIQYGLQLLVIIVLRDYYIYVMVALFTQTLSNIITAHAADQRYPDYTPHGKLDKSENRKINQRIRDLFTSKVGGMIVSSADSIVISAFLGLRVLAVYQNYYYILSSLAGVLLIVFNSCMAGIGNSLIVESKEKNYNDFKKITFLICWISGFCSACLLCLYQPFMKLWVGQSLMLEFPIVVCFCIYFYTLELSQIMLTYKDAGGIWHEDRFRPLATAMTNLISNLIMVQFWGIYGIILSTVLSTILVGMPWLQHNLFTLLFPRKNLFDYLKKCGMYTICSVIVCIITYIVCNYIVLGDFMTMLVRGVICCILPNLLFFCMYRKQKEFKESVILLDNMTKNKFHLQDIFKIKG